MEQIYLCKNQVRIISKIARTYTQLNNHIRLKLNLFFKKKLCKQSFKKSINHKYIHSFLRNKMVNSQPKSL